MEHICSERGIDLDLKVPLSNPRVLMVTELMTHKVHTNTFKCFDSWLTLPHSIDWIDLFKSAGVLGHASCYFH